MYWPDEIVNNPKFCVLEAHPHYILYTLRLPQKKESPVLIAKKPIKQETLKLQGDSES